MQSKWMEEQSTGKPNALAKGYDKENTLTVVLKVAKSLYQSEPIQTIMKWSNEPYNSPTYYRDLALNLKVKENFEMSIVFTHAKMKADVFTDTHLDELTITLTATQKEDKMPGVAFGRELEPTYEKALDRVNNPPRLNIYIPPVVGFAKLEKSESSRTFPTTFTKTEVFKPVMIKYIAEKKNCTAKLSNDQTCVQIYDPTGKHIRNIYQFYMYNGRAFCSSQLFRDNFNEENFMPWNERQHIIDDTVYERLEDAEMALGSIYFEEGVADTETFIIKAYLGKFIIAGSVGGGAGSNSLITIGQKRYYIKDNKVCDRNTDKVLHDMNAIFKKARLAWGKAPEGVEEKGYVTADQLIAIGWREDVVTPKMVKELNKALEEYGITNINSIRHFIAQVCHESDNWYYPGYGDGLIEVGSDEYLRSKEYWPYVGAGYIHLTWEYNYQKFSNYLKAEKGIDDPLIMSEGPTRIASTYAWESAAYFWSVFTNANEVASRPNVHPDELSKIVNRYDTNSFATRASIYYDKVVPNIK